MRIQLASDLHLEHLQRYYPGERLIAPAHGADVLVLAGDIAVGTLAIDLFADWPVPVLYVAGNHEFYNGCREDVVAELRGRAAGTSVQFLEKDVADFGGVRFLGCTLWTNYRLNMNRTQRQLMQQAQMQLNDHRLIRTGSGLFSPSDALAEHELAQQWLTEQLSTPYAGKTVVITHHAPHPLSVHPRYAGDTLNAAFVSELDDLIAQTDFWLHGHVHDSFDYMVGGRRVIANPRGYPQSRNAAQAKDLPFENPAFQWACLIDVPAPTAAEQDRAGELATSKV